MRSPLARLSAYWFAPMPSDRLAVVRFFVGGFALWYLWTRFGMLVEMAATDASLFEPVGVLRWMTGPMPPSLYVALIAGCLVLGVGFTLGWRFRWVGPAFAVLFLVVMCYRNSWSMVYHSRNVVVLSALVLAFVPAADTFSLDALRGRAHAARTWLARRPRAVAADAAYGWPIRLLCALIASVYLLSGIAKVTGDLGWGWASGDVLRDQIVVDALRKEVLLGGTLPPLAHLLYDHLWLFGTMAVVSLAVELGAPLALVHRKVGWVWSAATFGMHWGIYLLMSITFRYQLAGLLFAPFLPVEHLARGTRRLRDALLRRLGLQRDDEVLAQIAASKSVPAH